MKYFCFLILFFSSTAFAANSFNARVSLDLCPDYKNGQTSFELKYREEDSYEFRDPVVVNQTIDTINNKATIEITLPGNLGTKKFFVWSYCKNSNGTSEPSNYLAVSYCDSLAKKDSDGDGLSDNLEDSNCNDQFDQDDTSNAFLKDSDGDGVEDLAETNDHTELLNPASSSKPTILSAAPFDPEQDNISNPVAWRKSINTWLIKDNPSIVFGNSSDIPFVYQPKSAGSDVGTISEQDGNYTWNFHGLGFKRSTGAFETSIVLGKVGDLLVPGTWEDIDATNPAVARLEGNNWNFYYYSKTGSVVTKTLGIKGDIPKVQDYDGDGKSDPAVFRPGTLQLLILKSSTGTTQTVSNAGAASAKYFVNGDYTGDGKAEIVSWDQTSSTFNYKNSSTNYSTSSSLQLGTAGSSFPLNWNFQGGKSLFTAIDHSTAIRKFYLNNNSATPLQQLQWGQAGDHQG